MLSEYILVGQVLRPQGVNGLVKVRPDTDDAQRFLDLDTVFVKLDDAYQEADVSDVSVRDGFVYLRLGTTQTRDDADKQRDYMLYVDRAHARPLAENEHFICDLVGCKVYDTTGKELGELTDVMQPGANDVFVVKTPRGEMLVPALKMVVLQMDVVEKKIILDEKKLPQVAVFD